MRIVTNSRLQFVWFFLVGTMVLVSLLQWIGIYVNFRGLYFDRGWTHFLVYATATTLCMLVWKQRTAIVLTTGLFALSLGLHFLHWIIFRSATDYFGIEVNLLGIIGGVLLGLNILALRSRTKDHLAAQNAIRSADNRQFR